MVKHKGKFSLINTGRGSMVSHALRAEKGYLLEDQTMTAGRGQDRGAGVQSLGLCRWGSSQEKGPEQKRVRLQIPKNNLHLLLLVTPRTSPAATSISIQSAHPILSRPGDLHPRNKAFKPNA